MYTFYVLKLTQPIKDKKSYLHLLEQNQIIIKLYTGILTIEQNIKLDSILQVV